MNDCHSRELGFLNDKAKPDLMQRGHPNQTRNGEGCSKLQDYCKSTDTELSPYRRSED